MFPTKVVQKIGTQFFLTIFFPENRELDEIMWENRMYCCVFTPILVTRTRHVIDNIENAGQFLNYTAFASFQMLANALFDNNPII
jgi:hypothetical protein